MILNPGDWSYGDREGNLPNGWYDGTKCIALGLRIYGMRQLL